jgi:hypothetical protein
MQRTLAPAGTAHYYPRLAKLSTLPALHGCSNSPCTRAL